ncbi:exocyst complex component 3-like isoform X2 [Schistocerca gregaria]|uniref:exocyst complex component 3-like isoform X2 n=1 Tax=Schistocerca gregaria TaxID=7010 RepID=UPI00211DEF9C|nr:exocyst complex component 3-like isoform X2 [Schistocerca gregaria]
MSRAAYKEHVRLKNYNEAISLETQLKNIVNSQLRDAQQGIERLRSFLKVNDTIKSNDVYVRKLAQETSELIMYYNYIQEMNTTLINLRSTKEKLESLIQIPDKLNKIKKLFQNENNILQVHTELRKLKYERDRVISRASQFPSQQHELEYIFKGVDELNEQLNESILLVLDDHFNLALKKPEIVVKVMQIVMRENKIKITADNAALCIKELDSALTTDDDERTKNIKMKDRKRFESIVNKTPNFDYFELAQQRISQSIKSTFKAEFLNCLVTKEEVSEEGDQALVGTYDAQKCINVTRNLIINLEKLEDVQLVFPEMFDIRTLYFKIYHEGFFEVFSDISEVAAKKPNPSADAILIAKWVKNFYEPQMLRLNSPIDTSNMINSLDFLMPAYKEYVYNTVEELANRIASMGKDSELEILDDGTYTMAPVLLFNIVQVQFDVAISSSSHTIIIATLEQLRNVLFSYQQKFRDLFLQEVNDYQIDHLIAQINNNNKCYEHTLDLEEKAARVLKEAYPKEPIFMDVADGFQDLIKSCRKALLKHCFSILEEDCAKLFNKPWYKEDVSETIVSTLNDYFTYEIKGKLLDVYFRRLTAECLNKIVAIYVNQALNRSQQPFCEKTAEKLKSDANHLHAFFTTWQVREKLVKTNLQVLHDIAKLITSSSENISIAMECALRNSPDITGQAVKTILLKREDIDRKQAKSLMEHWHKIYENLGPKEPPTSGIFYSVMSAEQ